jgi:hypothetical protein
MLLVLSAAVLSAAPLAAPSPPEPRERQAVCAVVEVRSDQAPRVMRRFSATRILDLGFETLVLGRLKRQHSLQLRVYAPRGFLYQVLETELRPDPGSVRRLEARLPVAGTSIMASGLYGQWRIVPHLDGQREPCGLARSFVIGP